ncbi:hypothetical protein BDN70DRAFT_835894 [Pholiota conissans]|uniref:Magnesium transporter n=1 Tax=Pholiota conissans TaxID=109636 RepID=A0A9P5Z311_9AGAR|nr:hypothetical protein BDN70DRAFT_835894 [Pholiota conissans]
MVADKLSIPLGIIIGLLASFVQSLGLTIQRKSHVLNQSLPEHRQRVEHRRPLWLLGFLIFISSNILGSFVQIASLPVVILAPLGAVSLLWNAFFARFLLGDKFSPWMILGTILIAGGAIMIAFFGIVKEQTRSLEDLLRLFRRPTFIVYFSILGFLVLICLAITHLMEYSFARKLAKKMPSSTDLSPSSITINLPAHTADTATGRSEDVNESNSISERTPLLDAKYGTVSPPDGSSFQVYRTNESLRAANRTRLLLAISYASFSGIISGMCLLFAKSGVELLILTFGGNNQFWRWESWVLVLGLIIFALLQLWYLHKALILADPTLVCPSAFCFYNLSSIVNGLVYFNQLSLIPPLHLGLVGVGIFILLCGVWVVSIQPGSGGGVDMRPWTEDGGLNLSGEDLALYSQTEVVAEQTIATSFTNQQKRPEVGPVPMERETRSESHLPTLSPSSSTIGLGIDLGPPAAADRLTQSSIFPLGKRKRAETQLSVVNRRPMASSHIVRSRNMSYPHPNPSHMPASPSIGTVSTISTGFQIGLSPLSPGFTILPLERRRRPTGIQDSELSFADVGNEVAGSVRGRRRTVSEGDGSTRFTCDGHVSGGAESEEANAHIADQDPIMLGEDGGLQDGDHGAFEFSNGKQRWHWLRGVFMNRD